MQPRPANMVPDAHRLLDALADGAYVTDRDRRILYWNAAAERITGWCAADVVGRSCYENILVHIDKDGHRLCGKEFCPLHRSIVTGQPSEESMLIFAQAKDGRRVPVEVTVSPLRDAEGHVIGGVELFRDARESVKALEQARQIQSRSCGIQGVMDPHLDVSAADQPRDLVGGDFHRVERLDASHTAVLIADVAGHGVAAALYTMELRVLWDELRDRALDPAAVLRAMNARVRVFAPDEGFFATMLLLVIDATTGEAVYATAGHPPPMLMPAGAPSTLLAGSGPALGLLADAMFPLERVTLAPGDGLLLFTDGAFEVQDKGGRELGEAGLAALADALRAGGSAPLESVMEKLLVYSDCIHLADDVTLVRIARR